MRNYKITIEYDGSHFSGLQEQKHGTKTVYNTVEKALIKVFNGSLEELNFCGRTDAGVHAFGQVLNAKTLSSFVFPEGKLALGLNYHLRGEHVSAVASSEVDMKFHARYSCLQRVYKYKILNRSFKSPLYYNKAWLVPYKIDLLELEKIAQIFIGTFDFSNFRNKDCSAKSPVRTVDFITISKSNEGIIEITIGAKSFLYNMVRSIIGAIIDVVRGRISIDKIKRQLQEPKKLITIKPQLAPSEGLYFMQAKYDD